jgi:SAM-dependent methyltransferase
LRRFGLPGKYARFVGDWKRFRRQGGAAPFCELSPALHDRDPGTQSGGGHYFYQDIWALRKLAQARPAHHNDVGSRFDGFVGQVTAICPVTCWDIRPPSFTLPDFEFRQGSILAMPLPDQSLDSLSCLHTAEHIGLGRYGDPLDPNGTEKALRELARILAPGGRLLFSMPVGRERTEFNAQRIWHPQRPIATVPELQLVEFSAVDDTQKFLANVLPDSVAGARYACGLYEFRRPA